MENKCSECISFFEKLIGKKSSGFIHSILFRYPSRVFNCKSCGEECFVRCSGVNSCETCKKIQSKKVKI
jgi:hypothetical protein